MIAALVNHLWQSTAFALGAWLVTLALRRNRAAVRFGVWLCASAKFVLPLAWLLSLGTALPRLAPSVGDALTPATAAASSLPATVSRLAEPFTIESFDAGPASGAASAGRRLGVICGVLWALGSVVVLAKRQRDWRRVRAALRASQPATMALPIPVRETPGLLEPGVVGIRRPVLLMPAGLDRHLSPAQLRAVMEHELSHVRRRDNLTAAAHMAVEAIFWFHPLVWWIGARLIEERERACDEHVLRACGEPRAYAESLLRVCQHYVESPLACAAGVTGGDLKRRVSAIMANRVGAPLDRLRKAGLIAAALLALLLPLFAGALVAPLGASAAPRMEAMLQSMSASARFDVVSIKPCAKPAVQATGGFGGSSGGRAASNGGPGVPQLSPGYARWECVTLAQLVDQSYADRAHPLANTTLRLRPSSVQPQHVRGGPDWADRDTFTIEAKGPATLAGDDQPPTPLPAPLGEAVRAMLEDRFHLTTHRATESRDVYALRVTKAGLNRQRFTAPVDGDCVTRDQFADGQRGPDPDHTKICGMALGTIGGGMQFSRVSLAFIAETLRSTIDGFVIDETGVNGTFNVWIGISSVERIPQAASAENPAPAPRYERTTVGHVIAGLQDVGLTLEPTKADGEFIVIDRADRPSPDAPLGTAAPRASRSIQ